jgi:LuxR family maltose regulon positive regulatory protein
VNEYFPLSEFICSEIYISIKLLIQSRDFVSAKKIITSEISNFQGRTYLIIKLQILNSLLENAKLNPREAKRILSQALQMACTGGYVRSFLDEGPEIISLIAEIYDSAKVASSESDSVNIEYHKFLRRLLVDAGTDVNDSSFSQSSVKKLDLHFSNRQLEIIKLLVDGKSNKEIAACMFISENTVKFHLKNIFSELNISNRSQAIKVAREQNLTN